MFGIFTPKLGEDEPNLMHIFQLGLVKNHQLVSGWKMKVPFQMVQFFGGHVNLIGDLVMFFFPGVRCKSKM